MGVLLGHVPTVAQLRPGVVAVNMDDKETRRCVEMSFKSPRGLFSRTRRDPSRLRVSARPRPRQKKPKFPMAPRSECYFPVERTNRDERTNRRSPRLSLPSLASNSTSSAAPAFVHANSVTDVMAVEAVLVNSWTRL